MTVQWILLRAETIEAMVENGSAQVIEHPEASRDGRGLVITVPFDPKDYEVLIDNTEMCFTPTFEWLREKMGIGSDGLIEPVPFFRGQDVSMEFGFNACIGEVYADEEGLLKQMPMNIKATAITRADAVLYGPIIMQLEIND